MIEKMTDAQKKSFEQLKNRWARVDDPVLEIGGNGAMIVWVYYGNGHKMCIGIEPDGYTHS